MWNTSLLFDLNYKFELIGASLLALAKSIYLPIPRGQGAVPSEYNISHTPSFQVNKPQLYIQHFISFILNLVFLAKKDISFKISNTVEALLNDQIGNSKKWS